MVYSISSASIRGALIAPINFGARCLCQVSSVAVRAIAVGNKVPVIGSLSRFSIRSIEAFPRLAGALILTALIGTLFLVRSCLFKTPAAKPPASIDPIRRDKLVADAKNFLKLNQNALTEEINKQLSETSSYAVEKAGISFSFNKQHNSFALAVVYMHEDQAPRSWSFLYSNLNRLAAKDCLDNTDLNSDTALFQQFLKPEKKKLDIDELTEVDKAVLSVLPKAIHKILNAKHTSDKLASVSFVDVLARCGVFPEN